MTERIHKARIMRTLRCLLLLLSAAAAAYLPDDDLLQEAQRAPTGGCVAACADYDQDEADDATKEVGCRSRCRIDHCTEGCVVWEQALASSCQEVCNATQRLLAVKELYCTFGCQNAVSQYYQRLRADIGVPPSPILVEDSTAATSLTLKWDNSHLKQFDFKIMYFVQWKYENVEEDWRYCDYQSWNGNNQIFVHKLQPYTKYKFRLAIHLKSVEQNDEPLFSQPSPAILTFPSGPPTSAPIILRVLAIDHSRIYVNWKNGLFTNGPLFSYVLRLQQEGHEAFQLKDIPVSQDTFMFQNLEPNTNYSVTLTMRNGDGEGPATSAFVKTLLEPEANSSEKPTLLITSEYTVIRQSADILVDAALLYRSTEQIRDTTLLTSESQFFVSDSAERLYRISFNGTTSDSQLLLEPNSTDLRPWSLSVDWLNSLLYIAAMDDDTGFWKIARCEDLDCKDVRVLVAGLAGEPTRLQVDPYNGYLFWMTGDGIYRALLDKFQSESIQPEQILKKFNLGAFIVDYCNRRLLVAYQSENTIKSVSLDGKVVIDIRLNTKQPKFKNVTSISMVNGLFYWTNGVEIIAESYESNNYRYFHNVLMNRIDENFISLHTLTEETQPIPLPARSARDLQALVLSERATVSWHEPPLLGDQSPGAWSNWSYLLFVEDDINGEVIQEREVYGHEHVVNDLRDHSLYTIKIAPYSKAGDGPWSAEFKVQTIKKELDIHLLWVSNKTLMQSDVIGENMKSIMNITNLDSKISIVDISWYQDLLYIVGNNSKVYQYNTTSNQKSIIKFAYPASSVAIEWMTKKIYWADPKKRIIIRSNLDGSHKEPIVVAGVVKKLLIDSLEANLYWSTSRTVEVARLNGEDRRQYRYEGDFNGHQVASLTLDLENRFVYWIIGSYENDYKLYRSLTADMLPIDREIIPELVSSIHNIIGNSLSYISDRFIFLTSSRTAITIDAFGKYPATLTPHFPSNTTVQHLTLKTPVPPVHPETPRLVVHPESIDPESIAIVGTWRDFNVTWKPINNTSYGRVFYEVGFADLINVDAQPVFTNRNSVSYANADRLLPYSLIEVAIRAYTYWESAPKVSKVIRSPQSVPSQPTDPRVFVESYKDPLAEHVDYFITFRWGMPEFVNGPVLGFTVECWFVIDGTEVQQCDSVNIPVSELEYKVHDLQQNTSYFFQVCAFAEVGAGPFTDPISTSTDNENPVPQLLVATMEDVKKVDLDQRTNLTITRHIAVEVAHLAVESKIYWINEMQELVTADVDGRNITKILTLNNTAMSLCADWISRNLFWTESSYEDSGINHIMKLDLTVWEAGMYKYSRILSRNRRIVNLDIAPLTGNLFWMELSTSNLGYVMQSDLNGENIQPFFNHTEDCSCLFRPMLQPVFTIDNTDSQSPVVYFISPEGQLFIADIEGCICSLVLDVAPSRGLPPTSLTTDKSYIYWSNMDFGKIHYTDKTVSGEDTRVQEYPISDARYIRAIGKSLQPYPDSDCLMPQRAIYSVQQASKTSTSITVRLPEPAAYLGCEKYSLPATLYTIDVSECRKVIDNRTISDDVCENDDRIRFQTYWKEFEAKGLKPFTEYRFKLTLANYYGDQEFANVDQYGPGLVLRTGAGVPSEPRDVQIRSLMPTLAEVEWRHPKLWNAEYVRYKVFWRSTKPVDGVRPEGEKTVKDGDVSTYLQPLLPGQEYLVYVRAYPENFTDFHSQSEEKLLNMLPEPNNLTLSGVSSEALNISWTPMKDSIVNHSLEYTIHEFERWQVVTEFSQIRNRLIFRVKNLKSKEYYKFRLVLRYRNCSEDFVWPNDGRFTFQTLEDIPTAPGTPTLVNMQNSNYRLRWEAARSLGSQVLHYFLEGTAIGSYSGNENVGYNITNKWLPLYNGTENIWNVHSDMHQKYLFRVRARNDYGFGNWSEMSSIVDLTEMTRAMVIAQEHLGLILGLSVPAITIVLLCFCYCLCPFHKKSKEDPKKIPIKTKPNVELATLREIPRGNFVEANALYVAAVESNSDDSLLPKIQRDQISLAKFLGRGAFGEVFQGIVRDIEGPGSKTPIAVKTLRKGASVQEKNEFIQEAKLMSHFQHKHVLRLLGVCLDTDPPLLLLELMAGGDLLSYLRTSRALKPMDPSALRLQDLLSMCEDVARGCRYLEELHFVHRDLACRNCLVSARQREHRVVKIGDFGLARDIYKNDYYRKEGEGLLPVRWMAPESLVDGVFTSQSDVWAFGVLVWEITSLGQQPYQARTNHEVLHHVRAGGRLPKPLNCPTRLHQLMLSCWSTVDSRPSFKACLEHIVALRNSTEDCTLSPVNPGQFLHGNAYKSNHLRDNLSIQSLLQDSDSSKPAIRPKYSWLLDDSLESNDSKDPRAAYEIPKSIPVQVGTAAQQSESRYIEICSSEKDPDEIPEKDNLSCNESSSTTITESDSQGNPRWNRSSVASLNLSDKKFDRVNSSDKRSSTASLGDKFKASPDGSMKQSGSYARLVGNGESVSSLSDWRRVKKIANEERERLNAERSNAEETKSNASSISYSMVTFPQQSAVTEGVASASNKINLPNLRRTKSTLQGSKANIPLVINSALLNLLRQAPEDEDEEDDVNYANIDSETVNVTDL